MPRVSTEPQDPTGGTHAFMLEARAQAERKRCSLAQAIRELARARPDLHQAFVTSIPLHRRTRGS
ncbi:MAG: hypothetical protein AMXMBFR7_16220 [Planctomycetota bacterium]